MDTMDQTKAIQQPATEVVTHKYQIFYLIKLSNLMQGLIHNYSGQSYSTISKAVLLSINFNYQLILFSLDIVTITWTQQAQY